MKSALALFALVLSFHVAQAGEPCPDSSKAIQAYITAIQKDAKIGREFKKEAAALGNSGNRSELYNLRDMSAICIAQGVSMHSGEVSSQQTYLISHSLSAGGAGLVNDASVLALVTIAGTSSAQEGGQETEDISIRFTHLK